MESNKELNTRINYKHSQNLEKIWVEVMDLVSHVIARETGCNGDNG